MQSHKRRTCADDIEEVLRPEGLAEDTQHLDGIQHLHPLHGHLQRGTRVQRQMMTNLASTGNAATL